MGNMRKRSERRRPANYMVDRREAETQVGKIAEIMEVPVAMLTGYLVVGVVGDDGIAVAHNACCLPCLIRLISNEIRANPEMAVPKSHHTDVRPL